MASATHSMVLDTGEPAYAVDHAGVIVAWNPAASRCFGHSAEAALGRRCWELLQGRDDFDNEYCGESCPILRMARQHHAVNRCHLSLRGANGERRGFAVTTLVVSQGDRPTLIHLCRQRFAHTAPSESQVEAAAADTSRGILTQREREVLRRLAEGRSTREIATLLGISVSTVRSHVEHVLAKLDAHSRLEAVAIARRLGLG